ncbi:hypothetical protein GQR58_001816 [Nymphon striatum]|nr:hypothetical protein GQR58_001816 [Nymphon striatum]
MPGQLEYKDDVLTECMACHSSDSVFQYTELPPPTKISISLNSLGLAALKELTGDLGLSTQGTKEELFTAVHTEFQLRGYNVADVSTIASVKMVPAMQMLQLSQPQKFGVSSENRDTRWSFWIKEFEAYTTAVGLGRGLQKSAVLLHCAGTDVQKIADSLCVSATNNYEDIVKKLTDYFSPVNTVRYERYKLHQLQQLRDENVDDYVTRLRLQAAYCELQCQNCRASLADDRVLDVLVSNTSMSHLRSRVFEKGISSLGSALITARSLEVSSMRSTEMDLHRVSASHDFVEPTISYSNSRSNSDLPSLLCGSCSHEHHPLKRFCPAFGKNCFKCGTENHFASCCKVRPSVKPKTRWLNKTNFRNTNLNNVETDSLEQQHNSTCDSMVGTSYSDMGCAYFEGPRQVNIDLKIVNGRKASFLVDTGATDNIISHSFVPSYCTLRPAPVIHCFGNFKVKPLGQTIIDIQIPDGSVHAVPFQVVNMSKPISANKGVSGREPGRVKGPVDDSDNIYDESNAFLNYCLTSLPLTPASFQKETLTDRILPLILIHVRKGWEDKNPPNIDLAPYWKRHGSHTASQPYYLTAGYRAGILRQPRQEISTQGHGTTKHTDLEKTRIKRDELDVASMVDLLENNWTKPFGKDPSDLVCISTETVASTEVTTDMVSAHEKGEHAYKEFEQQRLQKRDCFHDPIKKIRLKTFSIMKSKPINGTTKEIAMKADRRLFGNMVLIAQSRKLEMHDVLSHPLGPLPWTLANSDAGKNRSLEKSSETNASLSHLVIGVSSLLQVTGNNSLRSSWFQVLQRHLQTFVHEGEFSKLLAFLDLRVCLGLSQDVNSKIFIRRGSKSSVRLVDITKLATTLGNDVCTALIGLHPWTGCYTSAFAGQEKQNALKILLREQKFIDAFATLGTSWNVTNELFFIIEQFVCQLCCRNTKIIKVNQLQYQMFQCRRGELESAQLPPCEDTLTQHTRRANYQAAIWRRSFVNSPDSPDPSQEQGWTRSADGSLMIQ